MTGCGLVVVACNAGTDYVGSVNVLCITIIRYMLGSIIVSLMHQFIGRTFGYRVDHIFVVAQPVLLTGPSVIHMLGLKGHLLWVDIPSLRCPKCEVVASES